MQTAELLAWGQETLKKAKVSQAAQEAEWLLSHALGTEKKVWSLALRKPIENKLPISNYQRYIRERTEGKPLAYLLGTAFFRSREYIVEPGVLIPRPETEGLVDLVIHFSKKLKHEPALILELGFGSGVIAIELGLALENATILSWDKSAKAYENAKKNIIRFQPHNVNLFHRDFFKEWEDISGFISQFEHLIFVSNPPYIATNEIETLDPGVKNYEPKSALDGGEDGLSYYRRIFKLFNRLPAHLYFEIGHAQKMPLTACLKKQGLHHFKFHRDERGLDRYLELTTGA